MITEYFLIGLKIVKQILIDLCINVDQKCIIFLELNLQVIQDFVKDFNLFLYLGPVLSLKIRVILSRCFCWWLLGIEQIDVANLIDDLLVHKVLADRISRLSLLEVPFSVGIESIVEKGERPDLVTKEPIEFLYLLTNFFNSVKEINQEHLLVFSVRMCRFLHIKL